MWIVSTLLMMLMVMIILILSLWWWRRGNYYYYYYYHYYYYYYTRSNLEEVTFNGFSLFLLASCNLFLFIYTYIYIWSSFSPAARIRQFVVVCFLVYVSALDSANFVYTSSQHKSVSPHFWRTASSVLTCRPFSVAFLCLFFSP